ncbi:hypothetical protein D3C75_1259970 [compost metagenome]
MAPLLCRAGRAHGLQQAGCVFEKKGLDNRPFNLGPHLGAYATCPSSIGDVKLLGMKEISSMEGIADCQKKLDDVNGARYSVAKLLPQHLQ